MLKFIEETFIFSQLTSLDYGCIQSGQFVGEKSCVNLWDVTEVCKL